MKKAFSMAAVAGVATGVTLEQHGMAGIQEVMDHFFPGIMTIGCAAMMPVAQEEIARQHPKLWEYVARHGSIQGAENAARFLKAVTMELGETLELDGPLEVSEGEATQRFADFTIRRLLRLELSRQRPAV